ncbi:MAG: Holliday junction branch migration protein RuvA [Propionibacteriaceae bacterium]|jgi:Holliday junction DNA helicase RuvA|nr:Holliday junction branch migration protein RuvA [Propionibacteriaceae bacterium]
MIAMLTGSVVTGGTQWLVLDVNGVGYKVFCPPATAATKSGERLTLHTSFVLRQDSVTLFGFKDAVERDWFELLLSVSGFGPKIALATVSVLPPDELRSAISTENVSAITQVPGVGKKSAQRLVMELKDKVGAGSAVFSGGQPWRDQVLSGLQGLGWSARDAELAVERVADLASADPQPSVAELMRAALQSLAK